MDRGVRGGAVRGRVVRRAARLSRICVLGIGSVSASRLRCLAAQDAGDRHFGVRRRRPPGFPADHDPSEGRRGNPACLLAAEPGRRDTAKRRGSRPASLSLGRDEGARSQRHRTAPSGAPGPRRAPGRPWSIERCRRQSIRRPGFPPRARITLVSSCTHFSNAYGLNRFLTLLVARFLQVHRNQPDVLRLGKHVKCVRGINGHVCHGNPITCHGEDHEVDLVRHPSMQRHGRDSRQRDPSGERRHHSPRGRSGDPPPGARHPAAPAVDAVSHLGDRPGRGARARRRPAIPRKDVVTA